MVWCLVKMHLEKSGGKRLVPVVLVDVLMFQMMKWWKDASTDVQ